MIIIDIAAATPIRLRVRRRFLWIPSLFGPPVVELQDHPDLVVRCDDIVFAERLLGNEPIEECLQTVLRRLGRLELSPNRVRARCIAFRGEEEQCLHDVFALASMVVQELRLPPV
jgi:hypothetical protein